MWAIQLVRASPLSKITMTKTKAKTKPTRRAALKPLETGQIWRMPEMNLEVGMIGKFLVHYKLGKPGAVRIPNSCSGRGTVEKYLKTNRAVLMRKKRTVS